jgi:hypothetical protein
VKAVLPKDAVAMARKARRMLRQPFKIVQET